MDVRIVGNGQNNAPITAATVRRLENSNPVDVALTGPSGEQYISRSSQANYGRVNVGTTATQIIASNPNRLGFLVQNLERQQMPIGWDSSVTVRAAGALLGPTSNSSGDGGKIIVTDYTGPVFGILASGDADVVYSEFVR